MKYKNALGATSMGIVLFPTTLIGGALVVTIGEEDDVDIEDEEGIGDDEDEASDVIVDGVLLPSDGFVEKVLSDVVFVGDVFGPRVVSPAFLSGAELGPRGPNKTIG